MKFILAYTIVALFAIAVLAQTPFIPPQQVSSCSAAADGAKSAKVSIPRNSSVPRG
jgi:hypothetical protein